MAEFKTPGCGTFALVGLVLAALGFGGWTLYQRSKGQGHARIQEVQILATGHLDMTLLFKDPLPQGEPTDVRVVFASETLKEREVTLGWDVLAPGSTIGADMLKPDQPPPLGKPVVVRLRMGDRFEPTMLKGLATTRDFKMTVTLFWGGTQQDRATTTLYFNYDSSGY